MTLQLVMALVAAGLLLTTSIVLRRGLKEMKQRYENACERAHSALDVARRCDLMAQRAEEKYNELLAKQPQRDRLGKFAKRFLTV
jgi:hypothetical protein